MSQQDILSIISSVAAPKVYALHPSQSLIAYQAGCHVILWNLGNNKKVTVHSHDNTVTCIQFVGQNSEYILSIDSQYRPTLLISEWSSLMLVQQHNLFPNLKDRPVEEYSVAYCAPNYLVIAEKYKEQYSISLWDLRGDSISLLASHNEDVLSKCKSINIFDSKNSKYTFFFAVVEKNTVKYWGYTKATQKLELVNKIHIKDNISDSTISPLTQFLLLVTETGKLCIVNKEGEFVSSVTHPMLKYSCVCLYNDYLFLGTTQGTVEIFQLSSLKYTKSLKSLRQPSKKQTNYTQQGAAKVSSYSDNLTKLLEKTQTSNSEAPAHSLIKMNILSSNRFMVLLYEDGVLCFYDFGKGRPEGSLTGHSEKIKQIVWDNDAEQYMVTSSNDGTLRVWTCLGDRWTSYAIDPPQAFEYTKLNEKARKMGTKGGKRGDISFRSRRECEYKVSTVQVLWDRNEIFAGDNRGYICLYELQTGTLKQEIPVGDSKIKSISFDEKGDFMGIILASGRCLLTERQNNWRMFITLEEDSVDIGDGPFFKSIKLLEAESNNNNLEFAKNSSKYIKQNSLNFQSQSMYYSEYNSARKQQDYNSNISELSKKSTTNELRVITTYSSNTIRLHQITRNLNGLNSLVAVNYQINGQIKDFDIHVSKEFLFVLGSLGYVYIFKITSGELKATIAVSPHCQRMTLDPSGLYVSIASSYLHTADNNSPDRRQKSHSKSDSIYTLSKRQDDFSDRKNISDQSIISFYEIWTGEFVGEIRKISTITCFQFSSKGNYLATGSYEGLVTILSVDKNIQANMVEAIEGVQADPGFWSNFPLFSNDDNNDSINQRDDRMYTDRSITYRDTFRPEFSHQTFNEREENPPTIKRILETFQGEPSHRQNPVKPPQPHLGSRETILTPSSGNKQPPSISPIASKNKNERQLTDQLERNLQIAVSNSSMQRSPYGSHTNSRLETPTKSVRFNDEIKKVNDYQYYYGQNPLPRGTSSTLSNQPIKGPDHVIENRRYQPPPPIKAYYNQGTQMTPMQVTPKVIEYQDIAQQTSQHDRSMHSAMSRRSEGSHFQKSINQMVQKFRPTEPDPADIDDDDRRPNILTRHIQPDPADVDDDVSNRESYGATPAFMSQKNYLDPPIMDTRFVSKDDSFMKNVDQSQRDVSEMYNDLSEFEQRFMRETTTRNYKA